MIDSNTWLFSGLASDRTLEANMGLGEGVDVVMDGDNHDQDHDHPMDGAANGFADTDSYDGHSGDDAAEEKEDDDTFGYPTEWRRRGQLPTGCCYDDRMKLHANADFGPQPHPEDPARIARIMGTFKKAGLVYTGSDADLVHIIRSCPTKYMWRIPAREATREEICKVHTAIHYDWVEALSRKTTAELRSLTKQLDQGRSSLYVGSMTYEAALLSAGGAIETCKSVVAGTVKNAFAIIRPPGHHAESDQSLGFCLFNNVPIAAKCVQDAYPDTCRKILILDWDVHHGNGIQNMFYEDPNILYISLHVFMDGSFYPGEPENRFVPNGDIDKCGAGLGLGKNVNIGWASQGMGDGEYMAAFQKIVMPIAQEFNPDLVIISAGFDAAAGDDLGGCFVTPTCYAHMTHMLMSLAQGKVAVCLEGGYNLDAISHSALAVARTLMGEPPPQLELPSINKEAAKVLAKVQAYQAPYWECMRPGVIDMTEIPSTDSNRLHDVARAAQRLVLSEKFGMVPLYVQRQHTFKSFENQILVTQKYQQAKQLLVIIHDP
jgi:histone deacetylase 6